MKKLTFITLPCKRCFRQIKRYVKTEADTSKKLELEKLIDSYKNKVICRNCKTR